MALKVIQHDEYLLECIQTVLPSAIEFNADLDATEDHLLSTLEIYSQLYDITVVDGKGLALHTGST